MLLDDQLYIDSIGVSFEGFLCSWGYVSFAVYSPLRGLPSEIRLGWKDITVDLDEAKEILSGPLEFGNQRQIDALKAYQAITIRNELMNGNFSVLSE
jgi:hypothetical protein